MNRFRQAIRRHRVLFLGFLLVETFFFVDGASIVEAQELRRQAARQELAETARVFGLSAEDLLDEPGDPLGEAVGEVRERASQAIESISGKLAKTLAVSPPGEGGEGEMPRVTEVTRYGVTSPRSGGTKNPRFSMARWLDGSMGEGGGVSRQGHHDIASDFNRSRAPGGHDKNALANQDKNALTAPPQRPRPRLRRSAAPPRAMPALEAGEGEQTLARSLAASEKATDNPNDRLPLRQVERKARTIDAGSLPPTQKVTSAIAPPSAPLAAGRRAAKAIAPKIAALAASLDNSPGKIFTHVHDTITYDPKWGADSPPLGTLWEGRGTSWDQAWLLQELLIAAGVDARLEWGEVEIDPALLLEITGVDDPIRAGDLLTTAGLPVVLIIAGSQVIAARMPHVWVKAHLDYIPNRGATAGDGDTWIRLDPSLQTFDRTDGERTDEAVSFVLGDNLQSGTEVTPRDEYEAALLAHGATLGLGTLDELKPLRAPHAEDFPFVPGTLRAKILDVAGESDVLPTSHAVRIDLELREAGGPVLASWSAPLAGVYGGLLELRWPGATSADQATLDLFGGVYGTPPYEVDLRPSLVLDGVEVATGSAIGSAEDAELSVTLTPPAGLPAGDGLPIVARWELFAGEHGSLAFDFGAMPQEVVDAHLAEAATSADPTVIEAASLAAAGATYLRSQALDLEHLAALRWHRPLNIGAAVFAVQRGAVSTNADGTPDTFSVGPLSLDVGARTLGLFPVDGVPVSTVPTMELLGAQGSVREGEALASVFGGDHVTAVGFLTLAVREGQTLTRVDATNVDAALAAATLSSDAEAAVEFAVAQGAIAWISETQLEINGWRTTGYILEDPATGAGGYFVTFERRFTPLDGAVIFHSPSDLDIVTAPTDVVATIDVEGIESWTLSTRPVGGEGTTVIATGTGPVQETLLGTFDPTLLLNGMHDIVLSGQDSAGQTVSGKITVAVQGRMKIGHFSLSFVDLAIPLSGLDIEIVRTYDSRQRLEQADFGQGWTLDIRQGSYRNNRPPGDGWQIRSGFLPCQNTLESKSHLTTIRLSDREVYYFRLNLVNAGPTLGGCIALAEFDYVDGPLPGARLEILGNAQVFNSNVSDELVDLDTLELFEPDDVRLTTRDGRIFHLDLEDGVTHLEDQSGNTLDITLDGITHSSGRGVDFVRDAEGRIERIVDPLGHENVYAYDAAGDLVSVTDRAGATTTFTYVRDHFLDEVINALGVPSVRSVYDDDGRLTGMIDASGRTVQMTHDIDARREVVTDRRGFVRIMEYDERGNLLVETDPLGHSVVRTYDGNDNVLTETDPLGRTSTFTYNALDGLESVTDPLGNTSRLLSPDAFGQPQRIEDALGQGFDITYDVQARLDSATDALGQTTDYAYTSNGDLRRVEDPLGNAYIFEYDAFGNLVSETDPLGQVTTITYDAQGNATGEQTGRTLPDGSTETVSWSLTYDAMGRVVEMTDPEGATTTFEYDALGRQIRQTDALGRVTRYEYDALGRRVATEFPDGTRQSTVYDPEGNVLSETDRGGRTTLYAYDAAGRPISTTYPDGGVVSEVYDADGQRIERTDELGRTTTYAYDAVGRLVTRTDPLGQTTTLGYDANGDLLSITEPGGRTTTYAYDALGRLIRITYADGTSEEMTYDAAGRRTSITDPEGKVTRFGYDPLGRLVSVTDTLDQETTFAFDEVGNTIRQTDALGRSTRFEFDGLGRQTARQLPDGERETMTYHADGRPASHRDFLGRTTTFSYDAAGRLSERTLPDGSAVTLTYTPTGQPSSLTDGSGMIAYQYDALDRMTRKTDPAGRTIDYAYDLAGNRTGLSTTLGTATLGATYAYDALDRLVSVVDSRGETYGIEYDARDNPTRVEYPNGVVTTTGYDALDRVTSLTTRNAAGSVLESYTYALRPSGRRDQVTELDGTVRSYAYDDLYRLVGETVTDGSGTTTFSSSFTYDAVGNRLGSTIDRGGVVETTSFTYDDRDRVLGGGHAWDANGNLLADGENTYTWDDRNRLRQVTQADGTEVLLDYDAADNLIRTEIVPPGETGIVQQHLVDDSGELSQVLADLGATGVLDTFYLRGDRLLGLERPEAGDQRYVHADALGSVRLLSDPLEQLTDGWDYSAFGTLLDRVGSDTNRFGFAGEATVGSTGLYHLRARWMAPSAGRFLGMDPFSGFHHLPMSLHRYLYANLDPVNRTDPSGLFSAAEMSVVNAIQNIVTSIQVDVGMSILTSPPLDPNGELSKIFILLSLASGGVGLFKAVKGIAVGVFKAAKGLFKVGKKSLRTFMDSFKRILRTSPKLRTFCFPAGTEIHTAEGRVAIESIEVGDTVLAFELEDQRVVERVVESVSTSWAPRLIDVELSGETISATPSHPFWVENLGAWVPAERLAAGMEIRTRNGCAELVIAVSEREAGVMVYNFEVAEEHNYFVGDQGILVHNGAADVDLDDYNQAINAALDWLAERGFKAEAPVIAKNRHDPMVGEPIGMKTADGKVGFRVEWDPDNGAHINVFAGKEGKGKHFKFPGGQEHVNNIRKKFKCR